MTQGSEIGGIVASCCDASGTGMLLESLFSSLLIAFNLRSERSLKTYVN